jgi:hypothetical protein
MAESGRGHPYLAARRALCRRCGQHTPLNCKLGMTTDCREKGIAFEGDIARQLGMG